jgi:hypothetical protein
VADPSSRSPRPDHALGVQRDVRRSACALDARRREGERILAMTPRERALLALELGERYARLGAAS